MNLNQKSFHLCCLLLLTLSPLLGLVSGEYHSARDRIQGVVERAQRTALKDSVDAEFAKADLDRDGVVSRLEFGRYLIDEDDFFKPVGKKHLKKKEKQRLREGLESMVIDEVGNEIEDPDNDLELGVEAHHKDSFAFAFVNSLAMIIVTELGDKTFFIAAIMAMKHKRILVYSGAIGALAVMTILSAMIGFALPNLLPKVYTHYAAVLLFLFFGGKMLQEAYEMHVSPSEHNEELAEVEEQFANANGKSAGLEAGLVNNLPLGVQINRKQLEVLSQAFTLTFLAEWGDRSQIATIALASSKNPYGVTVGGTIGHAICTGLAVLGGRMLATRISEKQVAIAGGSLFLLFALHSIITGP